MKWLTQIWRILKYVVLIGGSVGVIWKIAVFFIGMQSSISDIKQTMIDSLSVIRSIVIDYQVETNQSLQTKTGQIDDILKQLENLDRNQKIIILKSDESQKILEEIKNQQLINGIVDINYLQTKEAYVVQVKKKESEL